MRLTKARVLIAVSIPLLALDASTKAQPYTVLVGMVGNDTVAVDRFSRAPTVLEGVVLVRRPRPHTMQYKAALAPEGRFTNIEIVWRDAKGVELRSAKVTYGVDSIRSEMKEGRARTFGAPASLDAIPLPPQPYALYSYALLEHAAIVLLEPNRRPAPMLEWISPGATRTEKRRITRIAGDTVEIDFVAGHVRVCADSTHRLVWLSIGGLPQPTMVKRASGDIDIAKLTASFASRDTL